MPGSDHWGEVLKLTLIEIWAAYRQRYDLEHFFRFGKQRLWLTAYQTPDGRRAENWWQIVQLAYAQLWLAQPLATALPRPWERDLPPAAPGSASPAMVQRDFSRIIAAAGAAHAAARDQKGPEDLKLAPAISFQGAANRSVSTELTGVVQSPT